MSGRRCGWGGSNDRPTAKPEATPRHERGRWLGGMAARPRAGAPGPSLVPNRAAMGGVLACAVYTAPQHPNRRWRPCAVLALGLHRRAQASLEDSSMDAHRFDTIARTLIVAGSRRRALAVALGGVLGLGGRARPDDATAGGKCKPKCAECKKCKKGKNGKNGKCKPKANGTACATGTCQQGRCVTPPFCADKPDLTDCGNGQKCSGGVCATPPTCHVGGEPICANCCPGIGCDGSDHCACAPAGAACRTSPGCCTGTCVGFSCQ